jgi:hypothetical protein
MAVLVPMAISIQLPPLWNATPAIIAKRISANMLDQPDNLRCNLFRLCVGLPRAVTPLPVVEQANVSGQFGWVSCAEISLAFN